MMNPKRDRSNANLAQSGVVVVLLGQVRGGSYGLVLSDFDESRPNQQQSGAVFALHGWLMGRNNRIKLR